MNKQYKIDPAVMEILVNVKATVRDAKTGKVKRVKQYHNLVVTVGKTIIAEFIGKTTPSVTSLSPNYCAVGTDSTAAAVGNTELGTEIARSVVSSKTSSANVAYITGFFGTTEGNGTLREVGLFINATATVDSGILFNRVIINITKSASETLTIDFVITIT